MIAGEGATLPTVADLDELTTRVLAPNPSPMTLDGTNTYLLGAPGSGEVVCVDPGPADDAHRRAVEAAAADRDAAVAAVMLTHHHRDHAAAAGWAGDWEVPLLAADPSLVDADAAAFGDGDVLRGGGVELEALATPGHASDHLCLRVRATGAVLSGDCVLGRGTSVVAWPDGDMGEYLSSLERLAVIDAPVLFPGHGPVVDEPRRVVDGYLRHRRDREAQVLDAIAADHTSPEAIVAEVYGDVDAAMHPVAERTVRAHLELLVRQRRVRRSLDDRGEERFHVR